MSVGGIAIQRIPFMHVLGTRVHIIQIPDVVSLIGDWIAQRKACRYIVNTGMHGLMEGCRNEEFKKILNSADLFTADGFSVTWLARRRGFPMRKRVSGTDLMREFFRFSEGMGYRNFFYGDTAETLCLLERKLQEEFPKLKVAGSLSPPFRPLTPEEDADEIRMINESEADIIWVGLGLPKQEFWMYNHRDRLNATVAVGVGASFKFLSGRVRRAPSWLGDNGLEWLWRLFQEPKIVWRRVFFDAPRFAVYIFLEQVGLKKFGTPE